MKGLEDGAVGSGSGQKPFLVQLALESRDVSALLPISASRSLEFLQRLSIIPSFCTHIRKALSSRTHNLSSSQQFFPQRSISRLSVK